ncbi:HAD family acid phosphatase [Intrasporangium sp. YIM S08009]|uniref:HAD family acid phosphatase n=1 Tax=Intrasporangium zincisolvens TaxID=3080018 RepID=UPI002B054716|nr:HAD family acid phosphatase [Intrasporangium sp. YIM S08009]
MRRPSTIPGRRVGLVVGAVGSVVGALVVGSAAPSVAHDGSPAHTGQPDRTLTPRTQFVMAPDGSSGAKVGGEAIPNIDSVKKTIYSYYGDPGTGIANKTSSPYISELGRITSRLDADLAHAYAKSVRAGHKPAIVLDADDTTLWTYDMEVADMKFVFNPTRQDYWVQNRLFPATPSMVSFVNRAEAMGFTIFGLTGRNNGQKDATLQNLADVGYHGFTADRYFTKWRSSDPIPAYMAGKCVNMAACTTVEYKANTRRHIEKDLGYDIVLNLGDQWSDLQGGSADRWVKLPNPTYYLPSPDLAGMNEPKLAPRTHFTMKPDGSSGLTESGEGIPNIDSVKKTIYTYYGDPGTGIANKTSSPYISELKALEARQQQRLVAACKQGAARGTRPAVVLDADDTTLWTYDMEVADMKFVFNPTRQDYWVQNKLFPATPGMPALVAAASDAGCAIVGLTGRNTGQKAATLANLHEQGYPQFTDALYFTKWKSGEQPPSYMQGKCVAYPTCTTIEYKSATRAHVEDDLGYDVVANLGDQFSDLKGGHADHVVKVPNPTYYLP